MIFQILNVSILKEDFLDEFDRKQEIREVYRKINQEYIISEDIWTMDWNLQKKREVAREIISRNDFLFAAIENHNIIGYALMEKELCGNRAILEMLQVSKEYRRKGIGKKLISMLKEKARELGATEVYVSACPSKDTIIAYMSSGFKITNNPIASKEKEHPLDIQMICKL